jgi:DNA polymerase (family 10)
VLNAEIGAIFERMARVLAFKGQDRFRIMAYERAAVSIRDLEEDLASITQQGKLEEIPGIGKDLSEMIEEYFRTGKIKRYEQECRDIPAGLVELMSIPGLGPKTLALLHQKFHIRNPEDLNSCLEKTPSVKLKGFGQKKIDNIKRGIGLWLASQQRMLIGVALPLSETLLSELRKLELIERAEVAGSLRHRRETIGSDAHSTAQLDQIRYGVFQARRGWIESRSVINTWPWARLNRWLSHRTPARPRLLAG